MTMQEMVEEWLKKNEPSVKLKNNKEWNKAVDGQTGLYKSRPQQQQGTKDE